MFVWKSFEPFILSTRRGRSDILSDLEMVPVPSSSTREAEDDGTPLPITKDESVDYRIYGNTIDREFITSNREYLSQTKQGDILSIKIVRENDFESSVRDKTGLNFSLSKPSSIPYFEIFQPFPLDIIDAALFSSGDQFCLLLNNQGKVFLLSLARTRFNEPIDPIEVPLDFPVTRIEGTTYTPGYILECETNITLYTGDKHILLSVRYDGSFELIRSLPSVVRSFINFVLFTSGELYYNEKRIAVNVRDFRRVDSIIKVDRGDEGYEEEMITLLLIITFSNGLWISVADEDIRGVKYLGSEFSSFQAPVLVESTRH